MTTISKVRLGVGSRALATRQQGRVAFLEAAELLEEGDVELDFQQQSPTPSFVDECLGGLVEQLGLEGFKARVRLANVPVDARALVKHVVLRRSA